MNKEQIEEMARVIYETTAISCVETAGEIAEAIYNADFRKQEWISVEERLPEYNTRCLVFIPYGHLYSGIRIAYYSYTKKMWIDLDTTYLYNHPILWMPLPEAPMMKGGAE